MTTLARRRLTSLPCVIVHEPPAALPSLIARLEQAAPPSPLLTVRHRLPACPYCCGHRLRTRSSRRLDGLADVLKFVDCQDCGRRHRQHFTAD
jgi:hypothetical protein